MAGLFEGKVAWVTGASGGIGEAIALAFAAKGSSLVLSARSHESLNKVAGKCKAAGAGNVLILPLDLTHSDGFQSMAADIVKQMGAIDILVNNGGVSQRALVKDASIELYRQIMEINFFGTVAITKAVLPYMIAKKSGQIITISSLVGKIGSPLRSGYAASKHALHGFFDSLRAEVQDENIKVLMVCPGFIKTNISVNALNAAGNKTGKMDKNQETGMLPTVLADRILKAMAAGKQEIYVGGKERLILYIKRFFPALVNGIVRKKH
ncbi:MAG: SDR family oxidoreductase [Bacteroidota bacterium]